LPWRSTNTATVAAKPGEPDAKERDARMTTNTPAPDLTALINRLYQLEIAKNLDPWMELWDLNFTITFPLSTHPAIDPIRGIDTLRAITRQKMIDRVKIELDVRVELLADPLKALVFLGVVHHLADGAVRRISLLCKFTFTPQGKIVLLEEFFNQAGAM
jgi:hypothetical protein